MSATSGSRAGRVRVLVPDDEPGPTEPSPAAVAEADRRPGPAADGPYAPSIAAGRAPHAAVLSDMGRAPLIHPVRGPRHAIRPVEDAR